MSENISMKENVEQYLKFKSGEVPLPGHLQPKKDVAGSMFKNPVMEALTRSPIYVPQIMWLVVGGIFLWYAFARTDMSTLAILLVTAAGFIGWTFAEYVIHRFVYHTETNSDVLYKIQFNGHGVHHWYPKDSDRLAMPPVPGLILAAGFFGLFYLIMGKYAIAFFPGFMLGYDYYITIHYMLHVVKNPTYKPFRKLWVHHNAHHFQNPYAAWGVSTRLWDMVFGTMPKVDKAGN